MTLIHLLRIVLAKSETEEAFVNSLLLPHFLTFAMSVIPILARTKRTRSGVTFKGGITSYERTRQDIQRLLGDTSVTAVTTLIDYYNLPATFPGIDDRPEGSCYDRVRHLEAALGQDVNNARFLPFLTLHEFEAFLFAESGEIDGAFPDCRQSDKLAQEVSRFVSPEEINEGNTTHPAARILRYHDSYSKPLHGPLIAQRIGLDTIRSTCTHFRDWMDQLESLAKT